MSAGNPWLRFGLPLGSALILVAFLDTGMNFFMAWMDLGGLILYHASYPDMVVDWVTVIWIIIVLVWISANLVLLWYGGIAKGNLGMLTAWIATTTACSILALGLWTYALFSVWGNWRYFFGELYSLFTFLFGNAYIIFIGVQCVQELRQCNPLEPIGKGFKHIFKFYRDDPTLAAKFLLISELLLIGEYVFTRQVMAYLFDYGLNGHEGDTSAAIIAEEYVLRAVRFIITSAGLYFVVKGNLVPMKHWGMAYAGAILASFCVFVYLLIGWNAEHVFFTMGYYIMFISSLIYRAGILYCCMKVVQPYIASNSFVNMEESQ